MTFPAISHYPDTDTLYIELSPQPITSFDEGPGGLLIALDAEGTAVAITVEHFFANQRLEAL